LPSHLIMTTLANSELTCGASMIASADVVNGFRSFDIRTPHHPAVSAFGVPFLRTVPEHRSLLHTIHERMWQMWRSACISKISCTTKLRRGHRDLSHRHFLPAYFVRPAHARSKEELDLSHTLREFSQHLSPNSMGVRSIR
jgi:hypothetical protein